jgi:16S rRNA (uracil1498-N3)-methyltransferase
VVRRLHTPALFVGQIKLDPVQARHARNVLRLKHGDPVELFDDEGNVALATLQFVGSTEVAANVDHLNQSQPSTNLRLVVASAIPKGERADWMVEKLSELGVTVFIPLTTDRSVVKPEGKNKLERWARIATESAKQSRRVGVMRVDELQALADVVRDHRPALYLSPTADAQPMRELLQTKAGFNNLTLLIGPEGGWTDAELELFRSSDVRAAKLTSTILRTETAAVAAAAVALVCFS